MCNDIKSMKTLKLFLFLIGLIVTPLTFQSCLDDDGYSLGDLWVSVATVRTTGTDNPYFTLDDGARLWSAAPYHLNYKLYDGQRVQLGYTILSDSMSGFSHYIKVIQMDTLLTKKIAPNLGAENDTKYGTDPVSIKRLWVGGGYLNVYFETYFGNTVRHFVNLIPVEGKENTYEFRHNAYDDPKSGTALGFVGFFLNDFPDTHGETIKLTIKVKTFEGDKEYTVSYNSEEQQTSAPMSIDLQSVEKIH